MGRRWKMKGSDVQQVCLCLLRGLGRRRRLVERASWLCSGQILFFFPVPSWWYLVSVKVQVRCTLLSFCWLGRLCPFTFIRSFLFCSSLSLSLIRERKKAPGGSYEEQQKQQQQLVRCIPLRLCSSIISGARTARCFIRAGRREPQDHLLHLLVPLIPLDVKLVISPIQCDILLYKSLFFSLSPSVLFYSCSVSSPAVSHANQQHGLLRPGGRPLQSRLPRPRRRNARIFRFPRQSLFR